MTEDEWSACADPELMRRFLHDKASARKQRLFACACCRRIWDLLADERSRLAVEVSERHADRLLPRSALAVARKAAYEAIAPREGVEGWAADAAYRAASASNMLLASWSARQARPQEGTIHPLLLRDVFGPLPFRPVAVEAPWKTPAMIALAQTAYAERQFENLPVLGDALEEAGCTEPAILSHLRGPGPHVWGCWVLDLVLGKA
jgi:hypothetical protein